uniref:Uncharacterized protein n=1 Tax=Lepeophtheirus salmonis TaxID=72036 RepID=A0A0K2UNR8_LEPSM
MDSVGLGINMHPKSEVQWVRIWCIGGHIFFVQKGNHF